MRLADVLCIKLLNRFLSPNTLAICAVLDSHHDTNATLKRYFLLTLMNVILCFGELHRCYCALLHAILTYSHATCHSFCVEIWPHH